MGKIIKLFQSINFLIGYNWKLTELLNKNFSVASYQVVGSLLNYVKEIKTVVDIGANKGQFAHAIGTKFPMANIYSFEPDPKVYNNLVKKMKGRKNFQAFNCALGDQNGEIEFHKYTDTQTSSILKTTSGQQELNPRNKLESIIKVPINRLDQFSATLMLEQPVLVKIDVQGYEKYVLEGGLILLESIDYILVEASFIRMYDGESLFDDLHSLLKSLKFNLIAPVGFLMNSKLKIYQIDFLYKKT